MSATTTRFAALACAYWMWRKQFYPRTILNIGLSSGPEIAIWRWQFPRARIVGADPWRSVQVVDRFVKAAVCDGTSQAVVFCARCHSCNCVLPRRHRRAHVKVESTSIDELAADEHGPFFIWMDIEGGELPALKGAAKTLKQTPFLNIETQDWGSRPGQKIRDFMAASRYYVRYDHPSCTDVLYYNRHRLQMNWTEMTEHPQQVREARKLASFWHYLRNTNA